MSKKNYGSYAAAALLAGLAVQSLYNYSKTSEKASINVNYFCECLLVALGQVVWVIIATCFIEDTQQLGNALIVILIFGVVAMVILNKERKKQIYNALYRDRDMICSQYDLDRQMFRGIDITQLENNSDVQSVVNKMWFEPQHWLYRCKDGSKDLRYTRNNQVIPDRWYMVLQAHNRPYLLASGSQDNIAQIGIQLYYGSGIEIETL